MAMPMRPSTPCRHLLAVELEEQRGSLRLAKEPLHLFMGNGLAPRVLFQALASRGQVILGYRLIVQGGRVEEEPEGIRRLLTEVLQKPPRWPELWFRQLLHQGMQGLAIFHEPLYSTMPGVAPPKRRRPGTASHGRSVEAGMG